LQLSNAIITMLPMPRRLRSAAGGYAYHVLNRAVGRATIFTKDGDYAAFEKTLVEALERIPVRLLAYCLMPNHWHLLLWPRGDGDLSEFMRWLTVTHTQRWHAHFGTSGTGPLYQGRFKAFPIEEDDHLLGVGRYVERNALRAGLVERAEDWRWSSIGRGGSISLHESLREWPVPRPRNWLAYVNRVETEKELTALRRSVQRSCPYGTEAWTARTAREMGLESSLRARGRPRKPDPE
jgi:putative transposase